MGRNDLGFMRDAETVENLVGFLHGVPIGLGAHNNADEGVRVGMSHKGFIKENRPLGNDLYVYLRVKIRR
jgi:hypothetical protein